MYIIIIITYTWVKHGLQGCPHLCRLSYGLSWLAQGIKSCSDFYTSVKQGFLRNVRTYTGIKQGFRVVLTYTSVKQGFSEECLDLHRDQTGFQGCPPVQSGFCPWALSWWRSRSCPLLQTWPYGGMTHLRHQDSPGQQIPWVNQQLSSQGSEMYSIVC